MSCSVMGDAMTHQGAIPRKGPRISEDRVGLARNRRDHCGVKINQIGMIAREVLIVVDTVGVVTNRAGGTTAKRQVGTMASRGTTFLFE